ncbi:MAG: MFS transporter, partial [Chitinophagaceae bacterium]
MPANKNLLLLIIIFSQFAGTSVWFAGNAIIDQISSFADHATITSIVQFGFIAGTLIFSFLTIADRFNSSIVFFVSCCLAATANLVLIWWGENEVHLSILRFVTGFFLAGIYPVGMKIAADIFPEKLGKALGFLVGALVLGTAFPHFVRSQLEGINWKLVLIATSALAFTGGVLILTQIPQKRKATVLAKPDLLAAFRVFKSKPFRSAAFGYFGHMWELYAFWSVLPIVFAYHNTMKNEEHNIYFWSFLIM